jgi:hypothetical protein
MLEAEAINDLQNVGCDRSHSTEFQKLGNPTLPYSNTLLKVIILIIQYDSKT